MPRTSEPDYDLIEKACDYLDAIYGRGGLPASIAAAQAVHDLVRDIVEDRTSATHKAVRIDPVQQAGERFVAALRSKMPDEQVIAYLDQVTRTLGGHAGTTGIGTLRSDEKMAPVKKASMARLFDEGVKEYR